MIIMESIGVDSIMRINRRIQGGPKPHCGAVKGAMGDIFCFQLLYQSDVARGGVQQGKGNLLYGLVCQLMDGQRKVSKRKGLNERKYVK